jgi:uncharacterized Zn finger protein
MPRLHKVLHEAEPARHASYAAGAGSLPELTDAIIEARFDEGSYARGRQYFRQGAITDRRRQGMTLKALCAGSRPTPYHVRATLDARGIKDAQCSCPIGDGGYCKHAAALLLTWQASPASFVEIEELDTALDRRSKAELIALIKQMLRHAPELESVLALPLPVAGGTAAPVNPAVIRRRAVAAFTEAGGEWGAEGSIAEELMALVAIGDGYRAMQDAAGAVAVYDAVASAILDHFETYEDEGGSLRASMDACVEGLGQCLDLAAGDPVRREAILRVLFEIYASDVSAGGMGMGEDAPDLIRRHATPEERRTIAAWTRTTLPNASIGIDDWSRGEYGRFLLDLEHDTLDDEAYLRICRETGRTLDAVRKLLTLARVDEAMTELEGASDDLLAEAADLLVPHERGAEVARLVRARLDASWHWRLAPWLQRWYTEQGDTASALSIADRAFRAQPHLQGYKEVRALAEALGYWGVLQPQLLDRLDQPHHRELLADIYLDEGDIDGAVDVASEPVLAEPFGWGAGYNDTLKVRVARAAEQERPDAAIALYRQHAEELIALRGRGNYVVACESLTRLRDLYIHLDRPEEWEIYIAQLREGHHSLRALKEELNTAGL